MFGQTGVRVAIFLLLSLTMTASHGRETLTMLLELSEGDGLAAKYPGDQGIEEDPAVVFADDFEEIEGDVVATDGTPQKGMKWDSAWDRPMHHFFAVHGDRADDPWSCHGTAGCRPRARGPERHRSALAPRG